MRVASKLFAFLRSELELSPARWRAIGRIVVGCVIALTLVMTLRIPEGGWIILTIFIVSMGDTGASVKRAVQRQLSVLTGCTVAITLVILFHQQPWLQIPCMGVVIGVAVYLSRTSAAPSIPILGALAMILAIGGVDVSGPEGVYIGLWRFVDISLGNIIGTFCQALVWPENPQKLLLEGLAKSLRTSAEKLNQSLLPAEEVITEESQLALGEERVMNSLAQSVTWLDNAEHVHKKIRGYHHEMVNLIGDVNQIAIASQQSARASAYLAERGQNARFSVPIRERILEIQERCNTYALAIEHRAWTPSIDALPLLNQAVSETFIAEEGNDRELSGDATGTQNTFEGTLLSSAVSSSEALDSITESVGFLRTGNTTQSKRNPGQAAPLDSRKVSSTSLFRLEKGSLTSNGYPKINHTDLVSAAKAALGALIAYVYLNTVDWPGGITAVVTAVLVSLDNYGAMIQKSVLRIAGAAIGGLASMMVILFVIPNITSLPPFLVAAGLVCTLGAWVQTGSTRIAYTGLQIGLVAGLALASSHSPSIDLMPFRDRLLGIFTGLASVLLVYGLFGEIRARIWAVDNSAETLRLMAKGALIGLEGGGVQVEKANTYSLRYEIYRRISFGYRLLTEASYEDWFSRQKEKNQRDSEALHTVLDETRAIQRVIMSVVWNRLDFQNIAAPHLAGRNVLEDVGRTLPKILESLATRLKNPESSDYRAVEAVSRYCEKLRLSESVLQSESLSDSSTPPERNYHRLLRAQLGFYQQLEILLLQMAKDTQEFSISGDRFSLVARLRGSERRSQAPTIRPA
jgi:uncharacterized membrane protein YgaE (UPF0421/DUF939 family)